MNISEIDEKFETLVEMFPNIPSDEVEQIAASNKYDMPSCISALLEYSAAMSPEDNENDWEESKATKQKKKSEARKAKKAAEEKAAEEKAAEEKIKAESEKAKATAIALKEARYRAKVLKHHAGIHCRHWMEDGNCSHGDKCEYQHHPNAKGRVVKQKSPKLCHKFQRGECPHGDKCWHTHKMAPKKAPKKPQRPQREEWVFNLEEFPTIGGGPPGLPPAIAPVWAKS